MKNVKEEILELLEDLPPILCAEIKHGEEWEKGSNVFFKLPVGYDSETYNLFLSELNFEYDNGWGSQELFGTIWFTDGTWASRGEYDGSEWWDYNKCPEIPKELELSPVESA